MRIEPTPWRVLLARGVQFGVPPEAFWRLSVCEWRALVAPKGERLSRAALHDLAEKFPDGAQ